MTRISSIEAGVRTEATSMAVISDMGSERKPWTMGRPYWITLGGEWGQEAGEEGVNEENDRVTSLAQRILTKEAE